MVNIIIRGSKKSYRSKGSLPNQHVQGWSGAAKQQYRGVSQENKKEFQEEKKVQELAKQGFNEAAISGMTGHSEGSVKNMMKKAGQNIVLDGQY